MHLENITHTPCWQPQAIYRKLCSNSRDCTQWMI